MLSIYRKLLSFVPEKKYLIYFALALSALSALLTLAAYGLLYRFLVTLTHAGNLTQTTTYALWLLGLLIASSLLYFVAVYLAHRVGFRLETRLRQHGIQGLSRAGFRFFDLHSSGKIRTLINDNAARTHSAVAHLLPDLAHVVIMLFGVLVLAFVVSFKVGLILLIVGGLGLLILFLMMNESEFMPVYRQAQEKLAAEAVEYVRGIQVIKIFGIEIEAMKTLHQAIHDYGKLASDYAQSCRRPYVNFMWLFFGLGATLVLLLILVGKSLLNTPYLMVDMIMAVFLSGLLYVSIMRIMYISQSLFEGNNAVNKLDQLFIDLDKDRLNHGHETTFDHYGVRFEQVSFSYFKDREKPSVDQVSFELKEKRRYALIGSSGSGKSTIAGLIAGFYQADHGQIFIGDKPIHAYTEAALRNSVAFVFQNAKLFKGSIYDNVHLAHPKATHEEVMQALSLAGCDALIASLKDGENTLIGTGGIYLSGGEKQRIAMARAILKNAPILIMDEATAAVDPDHEHHMQQALTHLMQDKTVIIIAHRLSSIIDVDEIFVMEKGRLIERGSHQELMQSDTRYRYFQDLYRQANQWRVKA